MKTDYGVYPVPAVPPSLPAAGSKAVDPTFGTEILRVTDERDGVECGTVYSYWPSFNRDSTWLMAACTQQIETWQEPVAIFYRWDTPGFKWTERIVKTISDTPGTLNLSSGIWSGVESDTILVPRWNEIYSYDVGKNETTLVKNFEAEFPGEYLWQVHRSYDDDVWSWTRKRRVDYAKVGYAVWRRSSDKVIYVSGDGVDEVQIDKTGGYLVVKTGRSGAAVVETRIIDLRSGAIRDMLDGAPNFALGHSDNGAGLQVGEEDWNSHIWKYDLGDPSKKLDLLPGQDPWDWQHGGGHYSMLANDESWVLCSTHGGTGVLASELYMLATDGSGRICRLAHHHSIYRGYNDAPRPNISRDGKLVAFTSNWGGSSRRDLFVLRVDMPPPTPPESDLLGEYRVRIERGSSGQIIITATPKPGL